MYAETWKSIVQRKNAVSLTDFINYHISTAKRDSGNDETTFPRNIYLYLLIISRNNSLYTSVAVFRKRYYCTWCYTDLNDTRSHPSATQHTPSTTQITTISPLHRVWHRVVPDKLCCDFISRVRLILTKFLITLSVSFQRLEVLLLYNSSAHATTCKPLRQVPHTLSRAQE